MSTNTEERMKILRMIEENMISADQAALLLNSIDERSRETAQAAPAPAASVTPAAAPAAPVARSGKPTWFRVQVTDTRSGKAKVHVRLPLSLVGWGLKLGSRYTDELNGINMDELLEALQAGEEGKLIEVIDEEDGEHVLISVE